MQVDLQTIIAGQVWQSPIAFSSGHIGYADWLQTIRGLDWQAIGAISLKATTLEPRSGNADPRVVETPSGLINSVGLENPGVDQVIRHHLPKLEPIKAIKIANIAGSTLQEYEQVAWAFAQTSIDALEVNISCPNVKRGGALFGHDPKMAKQVVKIVKSACEKPAIIKLSPNQTDIQHTAEACIEGGADALSVINTVAAMMIDIDTQTPSLGNRIGNGIGGLSGPAVLPIALLNVHKVYQVTKGHIPIIGQGGITYSEDAIAMFLAGASAISLGTVLAKDIHAAKKIHQGLKKYLHQHQLPSIQALTGALKPNPPA